MEEIFEICDCVSVFRDGMFIGQKEAASTGRMELISMMVGREITNIYAKKDCPIIDTVLKAGKNRRIAGARSAEQSVILLLALISYYKK